MKLILEEIENVEVIVENAGGKKNHYITGIFLQGDIKNRNGRIYESRILNKEVERYIKEAVKTNRAMGELGHPCLSGDAEILTVLGGWKHIQDCTEGELVYTINSQTKETEIQPIKKVVINHHKGVLYNLKNRGIDTKITPDHRFLVFHSRSDKHKYVTAQEIYEDLNGENTLAKWYVPKYSLGLNIESPEYYVVPKSSTLKSITSKTEKYTKNLEIEYSIFSAFMGLYLSEGNSRKRKNGSYCVSVYQNEGPKSDSIRQVLYAMKGVEWQEKTNGKLVTWSTYDRRLGEYLHPLGICYDKYIPRDFIQGLNVDTAKVFLDHFVLGDGRGKLNKKYTKCDAFSTSKQLIDDIAQVAVVAGIGTHLTEETCKKDYKFADRTIRKENKSKIYFCKFLNSRGVYLDKRFVSMTTEEWNDNVYCIQVENTNFMVRQNGYTYWTGNCGPTINLDRVSHKIVSLVREGSNWVGKAKILDTPMGRIAKNLLDEGVKLGVSSRGMGSLSFREGTNYVNEDFMLATAADIVADPSAPDAFVNGIMESKEWVFDGGLLREIDVYNIKNRINESVDRKELGLQQQIEFARFLGGLY